MWNMNAHTQRHTHGCTHIRVTLHFTQYGILNDSVNHPEWELLMPDTLSHSSSSSSFSLLKFLKTNVYNIRHNSMLINIWATVIPSNKQCNINKVFCNYIICWYWSYPRCTIVTVPLSCLNKRTISISDTVVFQELQFMERWKLKAHILRNIYYTVKLSCQCYTDGPLVLLSFPQSK